MKTEQKIIITIPIGRFIISAKTEFDRNDIFDGHVENNYEVIDWYNVPIDETVTSPITIHKSSINSIDVSLLEETEYKIIFELNNDFDSKDLKIYGNLREHDFNEQIFKLFNPTGGFLNTKGYVGKIFLDVIHDSFKYEKPIEVRSKKIDYDSEYILMIEDLSKTLIELLFSFSSPLFQPNLLDKRDKVDYFNFILLTFLFRDENLPFVFEYLSKNLYSLLRNKNDSVPVSIASNIDVNSLDLLVSDFSNLQKTSNEFKVFTIDEANYVPLEVFEVNYIDDIDIPENRFFKYFLEYIEQHIINELLRYINEGYAFDKLNEYNDKINYYLSKDFFRDISHMDYIPLNSQVLQKREGYRELFQFYIMFELGLSFSWDDLTNNFKSYQKQLHDIYEYWCYFKILSAIEDITGYKMPANIFINEKKLSMNLEKGKIIKFPAFKKENKDVEIKLLYNNQFKKNDEYESYSVCLKPDYSIELKIDSKIRYMHFDAKYRATAKGSYKSDDIKKMHTYKDAILNSMGSYILYPGEGCYVLFNDKKIECKIPKKYDGTIAVLSKYNYSWTNNGVGAFSLKPGKNKGVNDLKHFIEFMINYECNLY